jgi:cytochrome c-type biogenesis protein CcmH/NrfG
MNSDSKTLKGYIKTENTILFLFIAVAVGFIGGIVFGAYRNSRLPVIDHNHAQVTTPAITSDQQRIITDLVRKTKENPNNHNNWEQLGHLYFDTEQFGKSIEAYEKSLQLRNDRPDIWTDLGVMYRRSGDSKRAVECFERALSLEPDHQIALFNKGLVLLHDLNDPAQAIASWETLIRINPQAQTPSGQSLNEIIQEIKNNLSRGIPQKG